MYGFMFAAFMISSYTQKQIVALCTNFPSGSVKSAEVTASLTANNPPTLHR